MEPILEVRDLTKIFSEQEQDFAALRGVSFCLYPGETLGIVGESGSGKSTLAKVICRLTEASGGQVLLEGKDLLKTKGRELREAYQKLQMVFQSPAGSFDPAGPSASVSARAFSTRGFPGPRRKKEPPSC